MTDRQPHVLIVIVTYESEGVIADCVGSISGSLAGAATSSTVIVDNGSVDDTLAVARAASPEAAQISLGRNDGYAAGINAGIRHGMTPDTDAVLVLNPDIRLGSASVPRLLEVLDEKGVGLAVPRRG
ncbi:MAG: glycosyltransferase [Microthrixaceae bacterium]|nr:glycosyltransferase [Microthrixaceae bacterium]